MSASASAPYGAASQHPRQILRFKPSERALHWSISIPFMVCYTTAAILILFFSRRPETSRTIISWIHRIAGMGLIAFPFMTALRYRGDYRTHLENIRQGWIWARSDIKWLLLMGAAAISSKIKLPEQGKFNAAEKLNFMMVMGTYPIFILTGLLLCVPGIHFVPWIVHVGLAIVATPLMLGHIYMAIMNPSTRVGLSGMTSGYVSREWAAEHYRRWYRENFETGTHTGPRPEPSPQMLRHPAFVQCPSCRAEHAVRTWPELLQIFLELNPFECPKCGARTSTVPLTVDHHEVDVVLAKFQQAGLAHRVEKSPAAGPLKVMLTPNPSRRSVGQPAVAAPAPEAEDTRPWETD